MNKRALMTLLVSFILLTVLFLYTVAGAESVGIVTEGIYWKLDEEGLLIISGDGNIPDYENAEEAPWYALRKDISSIAFYGSITRIGENAFAGYSNLTNVSFSDSITSIGKRAFYCCSALSSSESTNTSKLTEYSVSAQTDGNGTAAANPACGIEGIEVVLTATPDDGYRFKEWMVVSGGVTISNNMIVIGPSNVEIKAIFEPIPHTVAFDANGGTGTMEDQTLNEVDEIPLNANTFTKEGWSFVEWTTEKNGNGNKYADQAFLKLSSDVTLYAQWAINQYTITFDTDGGSAVQSITQNYGTGVTAPAETPTKTGYAFAGWEPAVPESMPAADLTVKALWTANTYYLEYNKNGGSGDDMTPQDFTYDVEQELEANTYTFAGYDFIGWHTVAVPDEGDPAVIYTEKQSVINLTDEQNATVTLYAQWKLTDYSITYDLDGGALAEGVNNPDTYTIEDAAITLNNPSRIGYDFAGWTGTELNEASEEVLIPVGSTGDRNYTATWIPHTYTVLFNANGGTGQMDNLPMTYNDPKALTLNTFTYEGHLFDKWTLTADGSGESYSNGQIVSNLTAEDAAEIILYAQWRVCHTVTFLDEDGITVLQTGQVAVGDKPVYSGATPTKAETAEFSYSFTGWDPELSAVEDADVTYTATYTAMPKPYTITFNTDRGSVIDPITQNYGTNVTAPANPTKQGYIFTAWNPVLPETMPAEDLTVNAVWTINQAEVDAVVALINSLPASAGIGDKEAADTARKAYDALTDDQKKLVGDDVLQKLTDAEKQVADAEAAEAAAQAANQAAADAAMTEINKLPATAGVNDKAAAEAARKAYDALTDAQKQLVSADILKKLTDAEKQVADAEAAAAAEAAAQAANQAAADAVIAEINKLPATAGVNDKAAVDAARKAYDALTDAQKQLVSADNLKKLTDAEKQVADAEAAEAAAAAAAAEEQAANQKAADAAIELINKLPATAGTGDKEAVEAARKAYNALTDDQKKLVGDDVVKKLTDAEKQLADAEAAAAAAAEEQAANQKAADAVIELVNKLPATVGLNDKEAVAAARRAYDTLTDAQKALVSDDVLKKLTEAETQIETLEAEPPKPPAGEYTDPDSGVSYEIADDGTATYEAPVKDTATVNVPDTIPVTVNGETIEVPVTAIAPKAFEKNRKLTTITIGQNIATIGKSAFNSCAKLKTVKGGKNVKVIEDNAFAGNKKLKTLPNMPELEKIGNNAFKGCTALTKATIGEKVKSIGKNAFNGCKKLKTITIKTTLLTKKTIGKDSFKGIYAKATFKCPKKVLKNYKKWLLNPGKAPKKAKIK